MLNTGRFSLSVPTEVNLSPFRNLTGLHDVEVFTNISCGTGAAGAQDSGQISYVTLTFSGNLLHCEAASKPPQLPEAPQI